MISSMAKLLKVTWNINCHIFFAVICSIHMYVCVYFYNVSQYVDNFIEFQLIQDIISEMFMSKSRLTKTRRIQHHQYRDGT